MSRPNKKLEKYISLNEKIKKLTKEKDQIRSELIDGVGIGSMFHYNYINKVNTEYMSYNSNALRMGKQIDIGNFEFIKNGYGDCIDIQVEPCSINHLKKFLSNKGLLVRV